MTRQLSQATESVILHKFPSRHRFVEIDCTKLRQSPSHFVIHSKTNTQITYLSRKNMSKNWMKIIEKHIKMPNTSGRKKKMTKI